MKCLGCLTLLSLAACGGDDKSTDLVCAGGAAGTLPLAYAGSSDLDGAAIAADAHTTIPAGDASIACAADIVPDGYVALGPAVTFGPDAASDRPFTLTLPYKRARLPDGAGRRHVRVVARHAWEDSSYFPAVANRALADDDAYASRATFRAQELTTYQVVAAADAGKEEPQAYGWNAIIGISMGGNAAMTLALRHPDRFDSFADLGGEPGPSMVYSLAMVRDFLFGGFCTAATGHLGELCPNTSTKQDQFEIESDFEHMVTQSGDGVGLTLDRGLYMKASRDLARALSNPALYNPSNPYTPPGVDLDYLQTADRCAHPKVLSNFYDREFNPDGSEPVITFCDGGDSPALGLAVFDPSLPQTDPAELLLAVDLNHNGVRDQGEPVITNASEPFADVGTDGLADADEPGYDALANPDPDHDDYHYLRNPRGTERNGDHDEGEPYEDVGLDGVASTCQAPAAGCYDTGEGNGKWDISPNVARWYASDALVRLAGLDDAQRRHMGMWFDAGIRDFLNASVSANTAVGGILARYAAPFGVYDGFGALANRDTDAGYDFTSVAWDDLPKDVYLRYGNPDASDAEIALGDGKHVGTGLQIINRATSAFAWLDKRWPSGDRTETFASGQIMKDLVFTSPTTGRASPYAMFLPPGYDDPANADVRYPVVYFLHGYGQEPNDLVTLSSVFASYMLGDQPEAQRFQKFIIVYVDGRCRTGDNCEGGTFYLDAPLGGTARMEQNLLDLMDHIDQAFRTKRPSTEMVTD